MNVGVPFWPWDTKGTFCPIRGRLRQVVQVESPAPFKNSRKTDSLRAAKSAESLLLSGAALAAFALLESKRPKWRLECNGNRTKSGHANEFDQG
jgi:hypothetical protein